MAQIAEIIKYEGDNGTFIWKHPCEDFNTTTQLIVHESQEAVFFMNGQALDLFGSGRYTLETQNIPLLRKFANIPTGGQTPFHCEVYFINKTEQMAIKWGTDSKVQYVEPTYKFPLSMTIKKLRDAVTHGIDEKAVKEISRRKEELFSYMDDFLNTIKTFDQEAA